MDGYKEEELVRASVARTALVSSFVFRPPGVIYLVHVLYSTVAGRGCTDYMDAAEMERKRTLDELVEGLTRDIYKNVTREKRLSLAQTTGKLNQHVSDYDDADHDGDDDYHARMVTGR